MSKKKEKYESEAVVHHIHHTDESGYKRELSINGSVYSVSLSTDHPKETINFLTEKALFILKELNKGGR